MRTQWCIEARKTVLGAENKMDDDETQGLWHA
jgi:hypothetical protein